jgi:hypothetical protein
MHRFARQSRSRAGPSAQMRRPPLRSGSPAVLGFVAVAELASLPSVVTLKHAATSMFTKRAARAATNPAILGTADARWALPGCGFVDRLADCAEALRPGCLSGRRCPLGAHCGAARSAVLGSVSEANFVNILAAACLNVASKASAVSSAAEPKASIAAESERSGDRHAVSPQRAPPAATRASCKSERSATSTEGRERSSACHFVERDSVSPKVPAAH